MPLVAFLMTYDDHEVDNNWAADKDQDGTDPAAFLIRRFAALQAWYENMPVRRAQFPKNGAIQMHRRLDYGSLLRVHLLDTRQYRDDQIRSAPRRTKRIAATRRRSRQARSSATGSRHGSATGRM